MSISRFSPLVRIHIHNRSRVRRWLPFFTLGFLVMAAIMLPTLSLGTKVQAQDAQTTDRRFNNPLILYGNDARFANNIVLNIDDNVYEGNIRWLLDILKERGIKASFFPHTGYMVKQDPQIWRDLVADGHEIGYFTRKHQYGFTPEGFMEDFNLYQQELREVLGDPNYQIRFAKPACWKWEESWFEWLEMANEQYGILGVRMNSLGPTESIEYLDAVFNNPLAGGRMMSIISFTEHIEWFEANLDALQQLDTTDGNPYRITSIGEALADG